MSNDSVSSYPRILTNMAFWQSPTWCRHTTSIYDMRGRRNDPIFMSTWREAWTLFRKAAPYEVIVTMGARTSLCYGLLCLLTRRPSCQIMTEVFVDTPMPGKPRPLWRMKTALYRLIARGSIGILTNSSPEVTHMAQRFRVPASKFRYVPMHTNIQSPHEEQRDDGFVLVAGRTLRDYNTLLKAAPAIRATIRIICDQMYPVFKELPTNVEILCDVPRDAYLDQLKSCSLVLLPLIPSERSTGQVVMLEAMALGKPIVATRTAGTIDHIVSDETGILVEPEDAEALAEAANRLIAEPDERRRLARQALVTVQRENGIERHAERKLEAIKELWNSSACARHPRA